MTRRTQVLSASIALVLLGGVLTACSTNEAVKPGVRSSASASSTAAPSLSSKTAGSNGTTASSTSTSPNSAASGAAPPVTWSPPSAAEQAKTKSALEAVGYRVEFSNPSGFPTPPAALANATMAANGLKETDEAAVLTVVFYGYAMNHFINGGSPDSLEWVSADDCSDCTQYLTAFGEYRSKKGYSISNEIYVENVAIVGHPGAHVVSLEGDVFFPEVSTYFPVTGMTLVTPDGSGRWQFQLAWDDSGHYAITKAYKLGPKV